MSEEKGPYLKQVIVVRKDLKIRRGKEIAQACHASRGAAELAEKHDETTVTGWVLQGETKIVVGVESEEDLLDLYEEVNNAGLPAKLVRDLGHTELEPNTPTAIGIGPERDEKIDEFTSHLTLL